MSLKNPQSLRVLISAYACCPGKGSEPGVGWNVAVHMSKFHEVWVLTGTHNRSRIEHEIKERPRTNLHFEYYDLPWWLRWWKRGQWGIQFHYYLWQLAIYFVGRRLHKEVSFDLSQHLTFGRYWSPSLLSLLPIPFILGPVGGAESAPKAFWVDFGMRGRLYEHARNVARFLGEHDPLVRTTIRRAKVVLTPTPNTMVRVKHLGARSIQIFPGQTGINRHEINVGTSPMAQELRFISIGRLLHWKGTYLGIRAFAMANFLNAEYWIVGDGPERRRLEKLTMELGVSERIKFFGLLTRDETLARLQSCHALVHLSLHDFSPAVCVEAMATGVPVICLDLGGPGIQITEETGFKIIASTPDQVVNDVARVMKLLCVEPDIYIKRNYEHIVRHTQMYTWDHKVRLLNSIYMETVK